MQTQKDKIIHFTTVHPRSDPRIAVKEVPSLYASVSANTYLFVQDGLGSSVLESGVNVVDTGPRYKSRVKRLVLGGLRMLVALLKAKPVIAHFHDPELIFVGLVLKLFGIKVVYDVHEDVPKQIKSKAYLPVFIRTPLSKLVTFLEYFAASVFDGVVLAGETLSPRFPEKKAVVVHNYPVWEEFDSNTGVDYAHRENIFVYAGGITEHRGARIMVDAMKDERLSTSKLLFAGRFQPPALESTLSSSPVWGLVDNRGWLSRRELVSALQCSRAGLVVLKPEPNYICSYPTKMYEYMAAGLPVIASDFPFWRNILAGYNCAIFVNPLNVEEVADAMSWVLSNPVQAQEMGEKGRKLMLDKFNWSVESEILVGLYNQLLS